MKNQQINYQNRVSTNEIAGEKTITDILQLIKDGSEQTDELIAEARRLGKGTTEYGNIKRNRLPSFLFNFTFDKILANKNIIAGTGLLYLDIDKIKTDAELLLLKEKIKQLPNVYACWKSLSGKGLSILALVDGMTYNNYDLFKAYFKHKYKTDFVLDDDAWKHTQKTVLSKDEELYANENCIQLTYAEVYDYCLLNNLFEEEEKVQPTYLIEKEKNSQGNYTAPSVYKGNYTAPSNSCTEISLAGLDFSVSRFNDKYKYADADKEYTFYPDGVWTNELYFRRDYIISEGKRRTLLNLYACKFIRINGESFKKTYNFVKWLRNFHCESPKTFIDKDIREVVLSALDGYKSNKIKMKNRKVFFPEDSPLSGIDRKELAGKVMAEFRANKTIDLLSALYQPGMKQKELVLASSKSLRTVKAYWNKDDEGNIYFKRPEVKPKKKKQKPGVPQCAPYMPEPLSPEAIASIVTNLEQFPGYKRCESPKPGNVQPTTLKEDTTRHNYQEGVDKEGNKFRTLEYNGKLSPSMPKPEEPLLELTEEAMRGFEEISTDEGWKKYEAERFAAWEAK